MNQTVVMSTVERRARRWLRLAVLAVLATLTGLLFVPAPASAAPNRQSIVTAATAQLGKPGCPGFYNSCGINWCAEFARWVWAQGGVTDRAGLDSWAQSFKRYGVNRELYRSRTSGYTPQPGDAIIFDWDHDAGDDHPIDHVAIVTSVSGSTVNTIGGNQGGTTVYNSTVSRASYSMGNTDIVGYVIPAGLGSSAHDYSGDGRADVLARNIGNHDLYLYKGTGGGFSGSQVFGANWQNFDVIFSPGDFDGDGKSDVVGRNAGDNDLYLYRGNGAGGLMSGHTIVGENWQNFDMIFSPGDFDGDGDPDVIARNTGSQDLYLYRGNGSSFGNGAVLSPNWQNFDAIFSPGDFDGDGNPDVLGRNKTTSDLYLYRGNGTGGLMSGVVIGQRWQNFDVLFSTGDFDGDGKADVLGRNSTNNDLYLYKGNGAGGLAGSGTIISNNWQNFDLLF